MLCKSMAVMVVLKDYGIEKYYRDYKSRNLRGGQMKSAAGLARLLGCRLNNIQINCLYINFNLYILIILIVYIKGIEKYRINMFS